MQHQTIGSGRAPNIDDVAADEGSAAVSLILGIFYWAVLGIGVAIPVIGAFWGIIH